MAAQKGKMDGLDRWPFSLTGTTYTMMDNNGSCFHETYTLAGEMNKEIMNYGKYHEERQMEYCK